MFSKHLLWDTNWAWDTIVNKINEFAYTLEPQIQGRSKTLTFQFSFHSHCSKALKFPLSGALDLPQVFLSSTNN
jgi:hypothetical protein